MTDRAQVQRAVDEAAAGLGGIDVCVDIIGKATWSLVEDVTPEEWQQDLVAEHHAGLRPLADRRAGT